MEARHSCPALLPCCRQPQLRAAFAAIYNCETASCNKPWMRGKLLQGEGALVAYPRCECSRSAAQALASGRRLHGVQS